LEKSLEGPLFAVTVAHSKLIKPAELRAVEGVFHCINARPELGMILSIMRKCFRENYISRGQFSEITIPHFMFAGADEVIE